MGREGIGMDEDNKTVTFQVERVIVPHEEGSNPELEPLFANHFELMNINGDIYLDIGIISPAQLVDFTQNEDRNKAQTDIPALRFFVLQRIAMGTESLKTLQRKVNELFDKAGLAEKENIDAGSLATRKKTE
jgi:hypothetical protein